uniref:Uncharacterized protein LOC109703022 n=1 Tax=Castor canadensis TaxID=51338 RepID=A0A8B7WJK6_CASCN|nr:uncharacterized protein LOC109703022 [Castor canadensis]
MLPPPACGSGHCACAERPGVESWLHPFSSPCLLLFPPPTPAPPRPSSQPPRTDRQVVLLGGGSSYIGLVASSCLYRHVPRKVGEWQTTSFCRSLPLLAFRPSVTPSTHTHTPRNFPKEKWLAEQKHAQKGRRSYIAGKDTDGQQWVFSPTAMKEADTCTRRNLKQNLSNRDPNSPPILKAALCDTVQLFGDSNKSHTLKKIPNDSQV